MVIYPSQSIQQSRLEIVNDFLSTGRLQRIYLNELGPSESLPIELGLMILTTLENEQAITEARRLLQEHSGDRGIIDLVSTTMVYKFTNLSRDEVNAMIGIELSQTRVYQEAFAEGEAARAKSLILGQLNRKLGHLEHKELQQVDQLSLEEINDLSEALLDFNTMKIHCHH